MSKSTTMVPTPPLVGLTRKKWRIALYAAALCAVAAPVYAYPVNDTHRRLSYAVGKLVLVISPGCRATLFQYDAGGNRKRLTRVDGTNVDYAYDALNRLVEITEHNRKYRFAHDPAGRIVKRNYPNGVESQYVYEDAGRLQSLKHVHPNGSLLARFDYVYDANGNRTSMTDNLGQHLYGYDKLDRLTSASFPSGRTKLYAANKNLLS